MTLPNVGFPPMYKEPVRTASEVEALIAQLKLDNEMLRRENTRLREQVSNAGWEASARHAAATGGWQ